MPIFDNSATAASADGSESRVLATDASDPVVRGTARHLRTQPDILGQLPRTGLHSFSFDDPALGKSYAAVKSFEAPGGTEAYVRLGRSF